MSDCRGCVVIGPTSQERERPNHVGVLGQLLVGVSETAPESWIFSSIPVDAGDMVATFQLHADGVGGADVVRVGTALALYAEPEIGDIGGGILQHLGSEDTYEVAVTPQLADMAGPIADWALSAIVIGGDADFAALTESLAIGGWTTQHALIGRTHRAGETGPVAID